MAKKVAAEVEEVILEGLETTNNAENIQQVINEVADFNSLEYLKTHTPEFPAEVTSAKCKLDREPKVQSGLEKLKAVASDLDPLFILLAAWWENKAARTTIKKALDDEAAKRALDPTVYMQDILRAEVEKFEGLQDAVDRMRYAITYFKPRTQKDVYKPLKINGTVYNVNLTILAQLKEQYGDDKETIKAEIIKVSKPFEIIDEL